MAAEGAFLLALFCSFLVVSCFTVPSSADLRRARAVSRTLAKMGKQEVASTTNPDKKRNMFHDYNKPVVLLGFSSPNQELQKLAHALNGSSQAGGNVIPAVSEDGTCMSARSIVEPDIVVVDFSDINSQLQSESVSLVERCYDEGLLAVFVNVDPESSGMTKEVSEAKMRLEDSLVKYSDYELCVKDEASKGTASMEHINWEMARLLARARLIPAVPGDKTRTSNSAHLLMGENTFFLSLSSPSVFDVEPYVQDMCQDVDCMELRADLLDCADSRFNILYSMQTLRRFCRPHVARSPMLPFGAQVIEDNMPIVYTVRTANQAGAYPDDEIGIKNMFKLLKWGLRGGVEVMDVESAWDFTLTQNLLDLSEERYSSQVLGSHHIVGRTVTTEDAVDLFIQCSLNGRAHGAKVVLSIDKEEDDRMAYEAALISSELAAADGKPVIPHISLVLGDVGQFSRIINLPFTPVTHESLPVTAAPGQLSANEIMTTRMLTQIFQRKRYAILGHNIAYSVSPQMHGAAFAATKLPHQYTRVDVENVQEFVDSELFTADDFGGTSVTIPHKQTIMRYMDELSEAASAIGSVNTVIVKEEFCETDFKRVIYGDNTDWKGIFNPLERLLGNTIQSGSDFALIVGAGGTARAAAYVAKRLSLEPIFFNRTPEKAKELVKTFGGSVVSNLDSDDTDSLGAMLGSASGRIRAVVSTLPAAAEFVLPDWLVQQRPIVFDVNYKPYSTPLLEQAEDYGCNVVRGSEMLWEQGVGQFELWQERSAPYRIMKAVVLQNCVNSTVTLAGGED